MNSVTNPKKPAEPKSGVKIVLVEDDPMIVDMYQYRLEKEGYQVIVNSNGQNAFDQIKREQPVIVLLDIILPNLDGFSILQSLKNDLNTKKIPVLILTNVDQEGEEKKGLTLGAVGYFIKSQHTPTEILHKVREIVSRGIHLTGSQSGNLC